MQEVRLGVTLSLAGRRRTAARAARTAAAARGGACLAPREAGRAAHERCHRLRLSLGLGRRLCLRLCPRNARRLHVQE